MHLRPHLAERSGSPEDPESAPPPVLRPSSSSYPSLPTQQPSSRPGMERDTLPLQQHPSTAFLPPDRTSITDHAALSSQPSFSSSSSSSHHHHFRQQHPHHPYQSNCSPMPSSSSPSSHQHHQIPFTLAHPLTHPHPEYSNHPKQQLPQQQQQPRQHVQSLHYSEHDHDHDLIQSHHRPQYHHHHLRQSPQTIDSHPAHQHQHQLHRNDNTPLRDQYHDDSSRPNQAYSRHNTHSPAYSSFPTEHNQLQSTQRYEQQHQYQQQQQKQKRHNGQAQSHDHTQRHYTNLEQQMQQQQHAFNSQTQEGHGPGGSLHNAASQQQQQQHQQTHVSIGHGQEFGSTMIAQRHHRQQQLLQPQPYQHHVSLPPSSSPSHSTNPSSYSSSFSSSSSSSQLYPPRSPSGFASVSTLSLSPSPGASSFQRHRARTLSSVSPYFSSSPKQPSSSYPSEAPIIAFDHSDVYVSSSNSGQPSTEWSPRRKRGRANQFAGFGSGGAGNHDERGGGRGGGGNDGGQLNNPQTTFHQRQSLQDAPMTMASTTPPPITATSMSTSTTTTTPYISYSSSLPSDLWMGEALVSRPSGSSQAGDNPFQSRLLDRSEDRQGQGWSQRELSELGTGTGSAGFAGSRSGSGGGARQDRISALEIPKTYSTNKRPLVLSPPLASDPSFAPFASFDRSLLTSSPGSSLQHQQNIQQSIQQQQQYQNRQQLAHSQGERREAGVVGPRGSEVQEQRAALMQHDQHSNSNNDINNNSTTTATTTSRGGLSESAPRANPSFSSSRRTNQTLPMPHFRGQLVQPQSGDSSYQRRFYSSSHSSSIKPSGLTSATAHTTASSGTAATTATSGLSSGMMATITAMTSTSTLTGRQASFKSSAPMPGTLTRKSGNVKRNLQLADTASGGGRGGASPTQDASGIVSIQLGRLLISTRQHVRGLLDSFIHPRNSGTFEDDIHAIHPHLEHVLLDLLNGMLQSHNAFAARDNISSQEQPMTFRPTLVRSLAHLRELLSSASPSIINHNTNHNHHHNNNTTITPNHAPSSALSSSSSSVLGSPPRSSSSSPSSSSSSPLNRRNSDDSTTIDSSRRHRISSRHPPSRLSTSTSYHPEAMETGTDIDSDTDLLLESGMAGGQSVTLNPDIHLGPLSTTPLASGTTTPASTTPLTATTAAAGHSTIPMDDHDGAAAVDLYRSTIEFLALMTAFVSVVCWLMQIRLLDAGHPNRPHHDQDSSASAMEGVDMEQDGSESGRRNRCAQLREFLGLFDDLDNVLNPIKEALSRTTTGSQHQWHHDGEEESDSGLDPMDSVGLFAWHYFLFASDRESPFEREAHAINIPSLHSVHFDVILNELYTTHILSMTAKEHQKDHGQFYTPPGVVDFMWKRTVMDRGHLLDQFVESLPSSLSALASHPQHDSWEPLIPTALDPCLGVSTFLSCYVRLLIQEAQQVHADTIWRSEAACRLLLAQICEHVWGIELDGFAFWMARCGILVALMPLVQHVQTFSHHPQQQPQQQLPRLHLFRSDTLQLTVPDGESLKAVWDRQCILQLRNSSRLQFDFIVTNPPYMIRKTGTFSAPDPEVYDWSILGASIATASSAAASAAADPPEGSSSTPKSKSRSSTKASRATFEEEGRLTPVTVDTGDDDDSGSEATMTPSGGRSSKSASESTLHSSRMKKIATQVRPTGSKGMMQAYGYFVWFAAQRIKPGKGVVCMITASQWLTLEFAVKLRAWLFGNCLMDEFFQFEPYKVFSKVQTDSLIFKIRAIPPDLLSTTSSPQSSSPLPLGDHRTVFLRHTDHHKPLAGILQDYMAFSTIEDALIPPSSSSTSFTVESSNSNNSDLNIMASSKTREELAAVIMAPSATPITSAITSGSGAAGSDGTTAPATYTYSFAPMMPSSVLTTFMLALTQDLGALCSAGTKKVNRLHAVEPLLWHRGPNTNPVYGLVVRMEYARAMFGKEMTRRWFRPALYWNGKNSPEGPPTAASSTVPSKALHREGQFWQGRDRQRLSKKEGSPAESYTVPTSDPQRLYALCMVDKESVKVLRQQVEQKVEGSQALWNYLTDVRTHFQPGLASKRKVASSGKQQAVDDEGVAFCSTNQCGADVPEKIVHPINYGYFSKTQPRQRFFLDTDSLAVTNQCIYLTLNTLSSHYDAEQCPPLVYFLTLLNSTTLQFFVLHHCQYDQQGRMRLFRESMAKIPFQDRDVKNHPERIQYVAQLGTCMIELKDILYRIVAGWRLTGSHHGSSNTGTSGGPAGRRGSAGGLGPNIASPAGASATATTTPSTGGGGNQGLLDWIRKGGNPPPGLLSRVKEQVRRMLIAQASRHRHHYQPPVATTSMGAVHPTSAHVTPTTLRLAPSSSILHLTKPRDTKTRTMGGALFPDTDTDTNTFTDTDTDTDDAMDPWVASRRGGKASTRMGRGVITAANTTPGYHLPQKPGSGGGQGQHSLARILNMPGDDETSMDEEGSTMTDSPLTMPRPMPIPEASRDRRVLHPLGGFGQDEDFEEGETVLAKGITTITSTNAVMETDMDEYRHPSSTSSTTTTTAAALDDQHQHQHPHRQQQLSFDQQISIDCDRILQAIERAVTMIEMVQWAVDQYGYMLYGIRPKFQKLLELELKIVYGARLESLIIPISPPATATTAASTTAGAASFGDDGQAQGQGQGQGQDRSVENLALSLGITVWDLYRWEGDSDTMAAPLLTPAPTTTLSSGASVSSCPVPEPGSGPTRSYGSGGGSGGGSAESSKALPRYAFQVLENAQSATQLLREIFEQFPSLPSAS